MLENEIPSKIVALASDADADGDIDDQFESVSYLSAIRWIAEEDERVSDLLCNLESDIQEAKTEVEARKSQEENESFFTSVPSASITEEATCRSIFSDIDQ